MKKIGLFFGGPSNEHEVSVNSAKNIEKNIDKTKNELILMYWDKEGNFFKVPSLTEGDLFTKREKILIEDIKKHINIALLMTHGKYGEDGKLQSIFELLNIPYCGCHVLSSALCMDKAIFKSFVEGHNINQTSFKVLDIQLENEKTIQKKINDFIKKNTFPIYVKPANSGSSLGVTKVTQESELTGAIDEAAKHDKKIILEQGLINPREIEVAVLGNKTLRISQPGELKLAKDFYNYDDKYKLNQAEVQIPAELTDQQIKEIKKLTEKIYKLCDCSGFARIDFFISEDKIYLNEINTLPGFTDISMFPMLMKHTGLNYTQLIDKIIELAY